MVKNDRIINNMKKHNNKKRLVPLKKLTLEDCIYLEKNNVEITIDTNKQMAELRIISE